MKKNKSAWLRIIVLIIPFLIITGIFQFVGVIVTGVNLDNINNELSTKNQLIISFFNLLGTLLVLFLFVKKVDKEKFIHLGFHTHNKLKEFCLGFGLGALLILTGYFTLIGLNQIRFEKLIFQSPELIYSIFLFFIISLTEEALIRGYVLRNLMLSFNNYTALIISSIIFTLIHGLNPNVEYLGLTNIFLAGLLLGIPYIYTKNLWFPIALHFSWNLFQTLFGFNVSGMESYSLIEFEIIDPNIFNGGAFGFEGSILSIILLLFAIVGTHIYYTKKQRTV